MDEPMSSWSFILKSVTSFPEFKNSATTPVHSRKLKGTSKLVSSSAYNQNDLMMDVLKFLELGLIKNDDPLFRSCYTHRHVMPHNVGQESPILEP
ncbi:hypothetical protein VNO77_02537 [Canavalia gladiata]|uniref:Uncharacterized protein n=1 Tax=Canavalia gladiata TaxID=3824 RepID=A0AAN9MYQ1_CANGL